MNDLINSQALYQLSYTGTKEMVRATGFQPVVSCSQDRRISRLS